MSLQFLSRIYQTILELKIKSQPDTEEEFYPISHFNSSMVSLTQLPDTSAILDSSWVFIPKIEIPPEEDALVNSASLSLLSILDNSNIDINQSLSKSTLEWLIEEEINSLEQIIFELESNDSAVISGEISEANSVGQPLGHSSEDIILSREILYPENSVANGTPENEDMTPLLLDMESTPNQLDYTFSTTPLSSIDSNSESLEEIETSPGYETDRLAAPEIIRSDHSFVKLGNLTPILEVSQSLENPVENSYEEFAITLDEIQVKSCMQICSTPKKSKIRSRILSKTSADLGQDLFGEIKSASVADVWRPWE